LLISNGIFFVAQTAQSADTALSGSNLLIANEQVSEVVNNKEETTAAKDVQQATAKKVDYSSLKKEERVAVIAKKL
jgi:hypothetical protein